MDSGFVTYSREYWLERAEEMRVLAELMSNPSAKQSMLRIAENYNRLADQAREKAALMAQVKFPKQEA
jgi:hypothetical protein